MLPHPEQKWSHGTNSRALFTEAIRSSHVSAIEADIVMGIDVSESCGDKDAVVPIMSHPPDVHSDLSASTFLDQATKGSDGSRILTKHIKLDFKDFDAVEPTLDVFKNLNVNGNGKTVFLNADVLEGPGKNAADVTVPADDFVQKCLAMMHSPKVSCTGIFFLLAFSQFAVLFQPFVLFTMQANYAFSLGFKVEVHSPFGHTQDHLQEMAALVKRHDLIERCGGKGP